MSCRDISFDDGWIFRDYSSSQEQIVILYNHPRKYNRTGPYGSEVISQIKFLIYSMAGCHDYNRMFTIVHRIDGKILRGYAYMDD